MAFFQSALPSYLQNTTQPLSTTGYPLTVGLWVRPVEITAFQDIFSYANTANANFQLSKDLDTASIYSETGTASTHGDAAGAFSAGLWSYVLARWISATNRRISVLRWDGQIVHAQNTTSNAPTALATLTLGANYNNSTATAKFDGDIAEFFMTQTDIVPGGGQTPVEMLVQLAYKGPFSFPHLWKDIMDYRELREQIGSNNDKGREVFSGKLGRIPWTNVGGVIVGPHPPLPGGYRMPFDTFLRGMV